MSPRESYLAEVAARLEREIPSSRPVHFPVNAVLAGRRNSPPDPAMGIPPLAAFGPIHYQELPELFMEFVSSLTGKSPATTGFGSEGALTKGPFNALWPVVDLNNALVSAILTGYAGFTTSAVCIGPNIRVDHDVSLLVPEIWCRMRVAEREPEYLIHNGFLEKVEDLELDGRTVRASRLGYRITSLFVDRFLGRIFETPSAVFTQEMLRPELQDMGLFAAGVDAIVESQRRVATNYFEDGSVEAACPPLKALLHIMACGSYEGKGDRRSPHPRHVHSRKPSGQRLVPRTAAGQTIARHRSVETPPEIPGSFRLANEEESSGTLNLEDRFSAARNAVGPRERGSVSGRTGGHHRGRSVRHSNAFGQADALD